MWIVCHFHTSLSKLKLRNFLDLYGELSYFAQYGTLYQRVTACWMNEQEGLFQIRGADEEMMYVTIHRSFSLNRG